MGGAVFLQFFGLRQSMIGVMAVMATSFKRTHASPAVFRAPDAMVGHYQPMPPPETPGHSGKSLVGSLLISPGPWCTQCFVCALKEYVSPVLWKICNQIPLASKVKFSEGSQSLSQIPRMGNVLRALELLSQCKNFLDIIVLQFVLMSNYLLLNVCCGYVYIMKIQVNLMKMEVLYYCSSLSPKFFDR